jgi:hypothetical protein
MDDFMVRWMDIQSRLCLHYLNGLLNKLTKREREMGLQTDGLLDRNTVGTKRQTDRDI